MLPTPDLADTLQLPFLDGWEDVTGMVDLSALDTADLILQTQVDEMLALPKMSEDITWRQTNIDLSTHLCTTEVALDFPEPGPVGEVSTDTIFLVGGATETKPGSNFQAEHAKEQASRLISRVISSTESAETENQSIRSFSRIRPYQPTLDYWPRGLDIKTWAYCAKRLLSFVDSFSCTAYTPFILGPKRQVGTARIPLQKALGICAAYKTLNGKNRPLLYEMIGTEVDHLTRSARPSSTFAFSGSLGRNRHDIKNLIDSFREELARLQALTLYQIIRLFSPDAEQRFLAESCEPLFSSWTDVVMMRLQLLEIRLGGPFTIPPLFNFKDVTCDQTPEEQNISSAAEAMEQAELLSEEMECAYRAILVSYFVRSVYTAMVYQTCKLLPQLSRVPLLLSPEVDLDVSRHTKWDDQQNSTGTADRQLLRRRRMAYGEFAELWKPKSASSIMTYDELTSLLLVACKGVDIITV